MSQDYIEIPTDKHVYFTIYNEHAKDLAVFASFTDTDRQYGARAKIMTVWGFKGKDFPIMKSEITYDHLDDKRKRVNEQIKYWLCVGVVPEDMR